MRRTTIPPLPPVLDVCCGPRHFWFDKKDDRVLFVDKRRETLSIRTGTKQRLVIDPDIIADFTKLPFTSNTFVLVVFDPPHIVRKDTAPGKSIMRKTYGCLSTKDWRSTLRHGFAECFRVLQPKGVLIFKWAECSVKIHEVLSLTPEKPLFGDKNITNNHNNTYWISFLKPTKDEANKKNIRTFLK